MQSWASLFWSGHRKRCGLPRDAPPRRSCLYALANGAEWFSSSLGRSNLHERDRSRVNFKLWKKIVFKESLFTKPFDNEMLFHSGILVSKGSTKATLGLVIFKSRTLFATKWNARPRYANRSARIPGTTLWTRSTPFEQFLTSRGLQRSAEIWRLFLSKNRCVHYAAMRSYKTFKMVQCFLWTSQCKLFPMCTEYIGPRRFYVWTQQCLRLRVT